jgi:hypothetical protein
MKKKFVKKEKTFKLKFLYLLLMIYFSFFDFKKLFNKFKNNKIIVMVFAGRKKYISILMFYLRTLLSKQKIHEIHFWQFTNNLEDAHYLESISNIHKSSSQFNEYREIFPKIHNKKFNIGIQSTKGGSYVLINDKYEIIFNFNKTIYSILQNKINNETDIKKGSKILKDKYLQYTFEINNYTLLIRLKTKILFYYKIEDNNFSSVKIHSEKDSEDFWNYEEMKNQNIMLFDSRYRARFHWYEAYKYYLTYDYKILLKMDDDIIYIDLNRFDDYINFITKTNANITLPNLVNHAISLFYNNKYGLIPSKILREDYTNKNTSLQVFNYYRDGKQAEIIHEYFINNMNKFLYNNIEPIKLDGQLPSICFFGIKKKNYIQIYQKAFIEKTRFRVISFDDERYTHTLKNNYLFPKFVSVHYHFGPQSQFINEKFFNYYKNLTNLY